MAKEPVFSRGFSGNAAVHPAGGGPEAASRVKICRSFISRLIGLMFRLRLAEDEGALLVFSRSSRIDTAIHMLFVPFSLGVFWLDETGKIVDAVLARPWRPGYISAAPACYVLELHASKLQTLRIGESVRLR